MRSKVGSPTRRSPLRLATSHMMRFSSFNSIERKEKFPIEGLIAIDNVAGNNAAGAVILKRLALPFHRSFTFRPSVVFSTIALVSLSPNLNPPTPLTTALIMANKAGTKCNWLDRARREQPSTLIAVAPESLLKAFRSLAYYQQFRISHSLERNSKHA